MNEELKEALRAQGDNVRAAYARANVAKNTLEAFDAQSRNAIKADGVKRTEADTDALVTVAAGRAGLVNDVSKTAADLEGTKVETQCLLAHVSLVCAETAAMSRISQ